MKRVNQLINGDQAVFFRDIGQMGMTKQCLDMTKA